MNINSSRRSMAMLTLLAPIVLAGCILDRSGTGASERASQPIDAPGSEFTWGADVFPGVACPTDTLSIQWNVGDPKCPEGMGPSCQTLSVTDNLSLSSFSSRDLTGSSSIGSVGESAAWTGQDLNALFQVTHDDENADLLFGWQDRSSTVEILSVPGGAMGKVYTPGSGCNATPNICQWRLDEYRLDMAEQSFINATKGLGDCVRITSICYTPEQNLPGVQRYTALRVSVIENGTVTDLGTVEFRQCIENLSLGPDLLYVINPVDPLLNVHTGQCCESGGPSGSPITPQPFVDLRFNLSCDTISANCVN